MDSIKNAFGYGAQSGHEPLSGETGQGTASQPYDAGNVAGMLLQSANSYQFSDIGILTVLAVKVNQELQLPTAPVPTLQEPPNTTLEPETMVKGLLK